MRTLHHAVYGGHIELSKLYKQNETLLFVFNCRITGRIQPRVPLAKAGR